MKMPGDSRQRRIFSKIYENRTWGNVRDGEHQFYSGIGSTERFTADYEDFVSRFIFDNDINVVVDLGCGDFQIGKRLLRKVDCRYIGVDIVPDLIKANMRSYSSEKVSFHCIDMANDDLPKGDLCLIRQVLQHLDNKTILQILDNVCVFPHCIITESQHRYPRKYNMDIKPGPWTRTLFGSGIYLDRPPFSRDIQTVLEITRNEDTIISTCLLKYPGLAPP